MLAARRQGRTHIGELILRCHLLCEQRCLNALDETFQPSHELRFGNTEFVAGRRRFVCKGLVRRSNSFCRSSETDALSSATDASYISRNRPRLSSSRGSARISASSWRSIPPRRITLAGCSMVSSWDSGIRPASLWITCVCKTAPSPSETGLSVGSAVGFFDCFINYEITLSAEVLAFFCCFSSSSSFGQSARLA